MLIVKDLVGDEEPTYLYLEYMKAYIFQGPPIKYTLEGVDIVTRKINEYLNDDRHSKIPNKARESKI